MGCGASAQGGAESVQLQRDLEQAREKIDALEAELQAARASQAAAGPRPEATFGDGAAESKLRVSHSLSTSASSPVAAAFEAARNAPDAVRISGASKADGTEDFCVNGIFQKKGDMRNGRALYVKMGSQEKVGLWFDGGVDAGGEEGLWCVGEMANAGTDDCRASTAVATTASSPDCAMVAWKVSIKGKSVLQTSIKVQVGTQEDIAADTMRRERQEAADHAEAAEFVRIAGATDAYDNPLTYVNGDYAKTKEMRNGRCVYEKISNFVDTVARMSEDMRISLWCDFDGDWSVGDMCDVVRKPQKSNKNP